MASISSIFSNSYILSLGASESIPLFSLDLSTGAVTSTYFDTLARLSIQRTLAPVLANLTAPEEVAGIQPILLSCVSVAPINGAVNLSVSSVGTVYSLNVSSVAAVKARVTVAHTVQGGFVGGVSQGANSGVAPTYNLQVFSSSGTWTKPAGAQNVKVFLLGAGGGGGSGRSAAGGTVRYGGSGGMGGPGYLVDFRAQDLTSTVAVTIGAGGTGGAAVTNSDGNNGTRGGATSFGAYILDSNPLGTGRGGTSSALIGGAITGGQGFGGYPPIGGLGVVSSAPAVAFFGVGLQAGGSGAGGAIDTIPNARAGGYGQSAAWAFRNIDPASGPEAGVGSAAGSAAVGGSPPAATVPSILAPFGVALRSGGGGGGAGDLAGTIAGGAGYSAGATDYGVGGGGGGGSMNTVASGAGGAGGSGLVAVLSW